MTLENKSLSLEQKKESMKIQKLEYDDEPDE